LKHGKAIICSYLLAVCSILLADAQFDSNVGWSVELKTWNCTSMMMFFFFGTKNLEKCSGACSIVVDLLGWHTEKPCLEKLY